MSKEREKKRININIDSYNQKRMEKMARYNILGGKIKKTEEKKP